MHQSVSIQKHRQNKSKVVFKWIRTRRWNTQSKLEKSRRTANVKPLSIDFSTFNFFCSIRSIHLLHPIFFFNFRLVVFPCRILNQVQNSKIHVWNCICKAEKQETLLFEKNIGIFIPFFDSNELLCFCLSISIFVKKDINTKTVLHQ